MRRIHAASAALAVLLPVASSLAQVPEPTIDLRPADVAWRDSPVPGVQTAVLSGNLVQPGLYLLRVKIAKDAKLMPHTHPDVRYTTVLSGRMRLGFGETYDESRMKDYPAGAIIAIPANAPHYVSAPDGEVIVQDTGIGPTASAPLRR